MVYDHLIVGAGLYGAVAARMLAERGARVLLIDRRRALGGNIHTEQRMGIDVHCYGAHIFHTSNEKVWNWVNRFGRFNNFINAPVAVWRDELYNLPFNMNTFSRLWGIRRPEEAQAIIRRQAGEEVRRILQGRAAAGDEAARAALEAAGTDDAQLLADFQPANLEEQGLFLAGRDVFNKLVRGYTEKQWGRDCTELPAFIIRRLPFRYIYDNNYFNDRFQGIPEEGYTVLVMRILGLTPAELVRAEAGTPVTVHLSEGSITLRLSVPYEAVCERDETGLPRLDEEGIRLTNGDHAACLLYTGMIDEFFGYRFGELGYRSLRFETEELPEVDNYQGNAVVNYTEREVPYTRIIEHKHFNFGQGPGTIITREYPADWQRGDEPYYPINDEDNSALYERYRSFATGYEWLSFGGRLGNYKYYNMDQIIEAAVGRYSL
ncbi:MAG: NAD(P)-binding protein [Butyrivibrio sp.]|nr:NAD(P)-binding protein [Butyrivibrio sp.]